MPARTVSPYPRPPRRCAEVLQNDTSGRPPRNHRSEIFGDKIQKKGKDVFRILLWNTGGIGRCTDKASNESLKMENLKNFLIKYDVDFAALTEQSMDLRMITTDQTFWAQTRAWFEYRRLQIAQNRRSQATSKFQVGGVISMVMNEMGHRVIEMDQDDRKLGRWSSVRTRGKNSLFTTIITAYCPCISFGAGSAYTQQLAHLQEIGIQSNPRDRHPIQSKTRLLERFRAVNYSVH